MRVWIAKKYCEGSIELFDECASWFIVNCIICQLPILFMWINSSEPSSIFSSFLSYLFTFMISSYYALISLGSRNFKDGWHHVIGWIAVIYLVIVFGILSVYPRINNEYVHAVIVGYPLLSYVVLLVISIYLSWRLCIPALTEKSKERAESYKATKDFRESKAMDSAHLIDSIREDDDDED